MYVNNLSICFERIEMLQLAINLKLNTGFNNRGIKLKVCEHMRNTLN